MQFKSQKALCQVLEMGWFFMNIGWLKRQFHKDWLKNGADEVFGTESTYFRPICLESIRWLHFFFPNPHVDVVNILLKVPQWCSQIDLKVNWVVWKTLFAAWVPKSHLPAYWNCLIWFFKKNPAMNIGGLKSQFHEDWLQDSTYEVFERRAPPCVRFAWKAFGDLIPFSHNSSCVYIFFELSFPKPPRRTGLVRSTTCLNDFERSHQYFFIFPSKFLYKVPHIIFFLSNLSNISQINF